MCAGQRGSYTAWNITWLEVDTRKRLVITQVRQLHSNVHLLLLYSAISLLHRLTFGEQPTPRLIFIVTIIVVVDFFFVVVQILFVI